MNRFYFSILALLCLALGLWSCQKAPELSITGSTSVEIKADGGSSSVSFFANRDWTVSCSESWVHVSPSSGSAADGQITVTVRCDANTTYEDRSATLTIRSEDLVQLVSLTQPANLGVVVPIQDLNVTSYGQTIEFEVQSNIQFIVEVSEEWVAQINTRGLVANKLSFYIKENFAYHDRSATISIKPQNGAEAYTIKIKQDAKKKPEAVDIGLSVKWASCNIGASNPEDYGSYFAWGETIEKTEYDKFNWEYYKWCEGNTYSFSKYNTMENFGQVDNLTVLEPEDDAAHVLLGGKWRMPTEEELNELVLFENPENYKKEIVIINGHTGCLVTYLVNGNSIFLPFAGANAAPAGLNTTGNYWSSNLDTHFPSYATALEIGSRPFYLIFYQRRYGFSIRPVTE